VRGETPASTAVSQLALQGISSNRGSPDCVTRPAATFVNYAYIVKLYNNLGGYVYKM